MAWHAVFVYMYMKCIALAKLAIKEEQLWVE